MALANILSEMPDLLERTLAEHTPDAQGFCRECRDATGVSATWPCVTRELAEQARSMSSDGPGTVDERPAEGTVAGRRRARALSAPLGNGRHRSI
ncbi:hypothetical protein [Pseudonocardia alni]|uniref:Uncharacterized protein n=1 Tax=Pseudonocardia alni TaxID=33907 RepID=A0A852WDP3_PSEA5|nr:hypothetical protein [Pseudonocardia antarctica]NYG03826.1 hypothetical protein [Pseudonocardia antarctica]